ncbi:unnamed protein product [Tilletia controversa]|nr:unnamed protein product [Tilletia controversa]
MLQKPDDLPPFRLSNIFNELQYVSTIVLFTTPILAAYGIWTTPLQAKTFWWSFVYYFLTGLGITAGYHRLFMEQHPGGLHLLKGKIGKDATTAFQGGIYDHSNAAHNLLSMMRVGVLDGGYQLAKDQMDAAAAARTPELSEAESSGSEDESPGTPTEVEPITATTLTGTTVKVEVPPVHPKAREYVVPGEVYSIVKRGELKANRVAEANGGKVGALLWNKKNKATAATA